MDKVKAFFNVLATEPAAIAAAVSAVIALLAGSGWIIDVSPEKVAGISAAVAVLAGLIVRALVTPVSKLPAAEILAGVKETADAAAGVVDAVKEDYDGQPGEE